MGAREAQCRPSLASCSFSEFIRRPCRIQTRFSSRPASSDTEKTRDQLATRAVAAYTKRGPLPCILCLVDLFLQGQEVELLLETPSKEQEGLFCPLSVGKRGPH